MDKVLRTLAVLLGAALLIGCAALLAGCSVTDVPMRIIFGPTPDAVQTQQAIVLATRSAGSPQPPTAAPAPSTLPSDTPTASVTPTPTETATPTPSPTPTVCRYDAAFEEAVAPLEGATLAPGAAFRAVWRLRNTGNCPWTEGFALAHVDGRRLGAPAAVAPGALAPGEVLEVVVPMVAPEEEGEHAGAWRMRTDAGDYFGAPIPMRIVVAAGTGGTSEPAAPTRP
jgi:hypothetical protein